MKHMTKEEYLNTLTPDKFMLNNLPGTIGQAYVDGIKVTDEKWRNAVIVAMKRQNIPTTPFFNIILNELNK